MQYTWLILSLLCICYGCVNPTPSSDTNTPPDTQRMFRTTDPSRIYFRNIRIINYQSTTQPGTRIDLYRWKRWPQQTEYPEIIPVIVDNWMQDQAFIRLEVNPAAPPPYEPLTIFWQHNSEDQPSIGDTLQLVSSRWEDQYTFATQIYDHLLANDLLTIQGNDSRYYPLFHDYESRNAFLITLRDYFRLIETK